MIPRSLASIVKMIVVRPEILSGKQLFHGMDIVWEWLRWTNAIALAIPTLE